jgi:DNA-binding LacI/PurR family transcriptional regulator
MVTPKLTSIDYNYDEFGRKLIDTAVKLVEGNKNDMLIMVTPTLVVRESSGKARGND